MYFESIKRPAAGIRPTCAGSIIGALPSSDASCKVVPVPCSKCRCLHRHTLIIVEILKKSIQPHTTEILADILLCFRAATSFMATLNYPQRPRRAPQSPRLSCRYDEQNKHLYFHE